MRQVTTGITVQYGGVTKRYAKGLTNRRCLLIFGLILAVVGVVGFFVPSQAGDLYTMGIGQSIAYLVIGVASLYVGEVWNSPPKRLFTGVVGFFFLVVAVAGFALAALGNHHLGIDLWVFYVQHPWENAAHLTLGVIFLGTALYPRRFREYSVGSSVSD